LVRLIILGVAIALPPAHAVVDNREPLESTPTTLYFHVAGFQDFPINTQRPHDNYTTDVIFGPGTNSVSCIHATQTTSSQEFHTFYGFLSPGYVEYDYIEDGKPRYHPERGISFDARFDPEFAFKVHWFMEGQATTLELDPDPNQHPAPIPQVTARATMRGGDLASIQNQAFNAGELLAQGRAGPFQLVGTNSAAINGPLAPLTQPNGTLLVHTSPSGAPLYEFVVPLEQAAESIHHGIGANIRIDVYVDNPACNADEGKLMPNLVRAHTSKDFRPRLELAILNPLRIETLHPEFLGDGSLAFHTAMNSPWGNYDVDEQDIRLEITGPTAAKSLLLADLVHRTHDHGRHQEAVEATYEWNYASDGAQDGLYTVTLTVANDQGTAEAIATTQIQIGESTLPPCRQDAPAKTNCVYQARKEAAQSPAAGAALLLALLVLAALQRRTGAP
jgi:hypothetical protein